MEILNYSYSKLDFSVISPTGPAPRFSPVLMFGLAVQALPLAPMDAVLSRVMAAVARRHPDVFERLSGLEHMRFLIDPTDLPFCFVLEPDKNAPTLKAVRDASNQNVASIIRGPLLSLLDLLEGRADGDALFFSRTLTIEGNTEAVVALRNALDGGEINLLKDLFEAIGPLARPAQAAMSAVGRLHGMAGRDMETIHRAINAPNERRMDTLKAKIDRLNDAVDDLKRSARRGKTG